MVNFNKKICNLIFQKSITKNHNIFIINKLQTRNTPQSVIITLLYFSPFFRDRSRERSRSFQHFEQDGIWEKREILREIGKSSDFFFKTDHFEGVKNDDFGRPKNTVLSQAMKYIKEV